MKTTFKFFESKRHCNVWYNDKQFLKSKMWSVLEWKEARPDQKRLNGDNPLTVEAESLEDAYQQYVEHLKVVRVIAKQKKEEREALRQAKLNELLSMSVIPVNIEYLSLIFNHLNTIYRISLL